MIKFIELTKVLNVFVASVVLKMSRFDFNFSDFDCDLQFDHAHPLWIELR